MTLVIPVHVIFIDLVVRSMTRQFNNLIETMTDQAFKTWILSSYFPFITKHLIIHSLYRKKNKELNECLFFKWTFGDKDVT